MMNWYFLIIARLRAAMFFFVVFFLGGGNFFLLLFISKYLKVGYSYNCNLFLKNVYDVMNNRLSTKRSNSIFFL